MVALAYAERVATGGSEHDERAQVTVRLASKRKREQLNAIAKARKERDLLGWGAHVVLRRAVDAYIARHKDLLPPELRD